ncbi:hypothetical protein CSOJ01_15207 [Colletotrichum sojae]|uniref:Uncharacterized protein n=1 Tax=Colletotrichum sojae TaxID=2175907 RepID=A0A8H6INK3_9PEZI|nr:hypothetical protein CSOJ01_15207 [Colletotrichum sojae]
MGQQIRKSDHMLLFHPSANRNKAASNDPFRFNVHLLFMKTRRGGSATTGVERRIRAETSGEGSSEGSSQPGLREGLQPPGGTPSDTAEARWQSLSTTYLVRYSRCLSKDADDVTQQVVQCRTDDNQRHIAPVPHLHSRERIRGGEADKTAIRAHLARHELTKAICKTVFFAELCIALGSDRTFENPSFINGANHSRNVNRSRGASLTPPQTRRLLFSLLPPMHKALVEKAVAMIWVQVRQQCASDELLAALRFRFAALLQMK